MKIIRRFLLFARLSYYFTPYNRLTDYSLQVHKLKKSSTLLSFWPAGFIPPPNDWKLTDIFIPISTLWARCGGWALIIKIFWPIVLGLFRVHCNDGKWKQLVHFMPASIKRGSTVQWASSALAVVAARTFWTGPCLETNSLVASLYYFVFHLISSCSDLLQQ